jgi:hypothetical protein
MTEPYDATKSVETDPLLDFRSPELIQNPYPFYDRVRARAPVYYSTAQRLWFVSTYDDVHRCLRDRRLGSLGNALRSASPMQGLPEDSAFARLYRRWIITRDDASHTRLRVLMTKAFTPKAVARLGPRIGEIVEALLNAALARGEVDFIRELAYPLPLTVISDLLGIPVEARTLLHGWAVDAMPLFEPTGRAAAWAQAERALQAMETYLGELVAERRAHPREAVLDALIAAEENGDRLTEDEIVANVILLFAAGHETTTNLLGNGLFALLTHERELARLRQDRSLVPQAIEELLRFDSPAQLIRRAAYEPVTVGNALIAAGDLVVLGVGAAHRDPNRYHHPHELDVTREDVQTLAFGGGMHACLGAHLSRAQARCAFEQLLEKTRDIALCEPPRYRPLSNLRGLSELRVQLRA